ncbi:MAG: DegV family protein [Ilumatobacteraceae bacterium]
MIGICTDSNSQLPQQLAERYDIEVVPVTVTVDDHEYLEGVDLDADEFYEMLRDDARPRMSTSQPSPGQFAAAYESLLQRGCDEILSIHVTASTSGTINSARLATRALPIPVRLVDSGTAGFGVSCCVWAAADAVSKGAKVDEAVHIAETLAPQIGALFVVGEPDFIRSGELNGRAGVPVMTVHDGELDVAARVSTPEEVITTIAAKAIAWAPRLNVAVGMADMSGKQLTDSLASIISESPNVLEIVRYRIGPSVGVYAGLGAVGCFMFPAA